ncbi:MAG TPA: hypothetical protein VK435_00330, partial [Thermodesulfovibrionales bacterium]|nr:hypothetical protein [Thermodesulfovibrionales bacterium]
NEIQSLAMENATSGSREESVPTDTTSDVIEAAAESAQEGDKDLDRIKIQKEIEDEQKKLRQKALFNVQASVIIDSIGKKEGIIVTDEELDQRVTLLAQRLSATPEAVRSYYSYKEGSLDSLKQSILQDKVLDLLLSRAVIEKEDDK